MNTLDKFLSDCGWSVMVEENNYNQDELTGFYNNVHELYTYESLEEYCKENEINDDYDVYCDMDLISILEYYNNIEKEKFLQYCYYGNIDVMYFKNENYYGTYVNNSY